MTRRPIPIRTKLEAALRQLGFEPHEVELDHDPALALRAIDPETGDTIPPANDARYLVWRPKGEHLRKTTGRKGESALSSDGNGDTTRAAKVKRLSFEQEAFRARMLAKEPGGTPEREHKTGRFRGWRKFNGKAVFR